jgi:carbon-monoxide dehydrogenase medium subunit
MTLVPTMKQRLAAPSDLIDLNGIAELSGIAREGDSVVIGAMTRHADVAASDVVRGAIPALAALAEGIGDPQVRNRGTLGGSVANADPAADYPAALVGLNATVHTDRRAVAADDFFTSLFETALGDDEIITRVSFPVPEKAAYMKFPNPASRYAIVGVFVAKGTNGVRVAVTGAGASVYRVTEMEQALASSFAPEAVAAISVPADELNSDIHASAEYRAHLVTVMAKRAVAKANG